MSTQQSEIEPTTTPAWLNIAAVAGLVLFLTAGFLFWRHNAKKNLPGELETTLRGEPPFVKPSYIRPGENDSRFVFANPDIADAREFRALAERDPKAAAEVIARLEDTPNRDERLYELMQIWVGKDPTQAAAWVVGLSIGSLKNDATAELGLAWGSVDPESAASWVEENIFTQNAPAGAASLTSAWARTDLESVTEWIESLDPDVPARQDAAKALAYHLGELDPERGKAWLSRLKEKDRNRVAVNFATSWSDHDPRAAADWLRFQAREISAAVRDQAMLAVIHSWTHTEDEAANASTWIDGLADGVLKENAKATFAESHAENSPSEALPWAQNIKDPERRQEVTMVVYEEWAIQDLDGFKDEITRSWDTLDQSLRHEVYDLLLEEDPDFKSELFKMLDRRGTEDP